MSEVSPLIVDWIEKGLNWYYVFPTPPVTAIPLLPGQMLRIANYDKKDGPEGALIHFNAFFDSPLCGTRLESGPGLDTGRALTVNLLVTGGLTVPTAGSKVYARIPPATPAGLYGMHVEKEWVWKEYCRIYIFNTDVVPHVCISFGYTMVILHPPGRKKVVTL